jgi:hypothetical protein
MEQFEDSLAKGYTGELVDVTEIVSEITSALGTKTAAPPTPLTVADFEEEDTGFQYDLTATYEVNYSPMSDGYDDYDTYKIRLKLESDDPNFIEQPELELDLTMHNKGKLEQLLKLIDTVFDLGKYNSENYLCIDAKSIETSDLEL